MTLADAATGATPADHPPPVYAFRVYLVSTAIFYGWLTWSTGRDRRWLQTPSYRFLRYLGGATTLVVAFTVVVALCLAALSIRSRVLARLANIGGVIVHAYISFGLALAAATGTPGASWLGVAFWVYIGLLHYTMGSVPRDPRFWVRR